MSIDKAMGNGIHCARCVFVTTQPRPSDMYCPWCMGEAKSRIAELEAMVRELLNIWFISGEAREKALALLNQEERNP